MIKKICASWALCGVLALVLAGCSGTDRQMDAAGAADGLGRHTEAALMLGMARELRRAGRPDDGIALLAPSAQSAGAGAELLVEMGRLEIAAGRPERAVTALEGALRRNPMDIDANHMMAVALDRQGRPESARAYYDRALRGAPDDPRILNNFGLSVAMAGDPASAAEILRRASSRPTASARQIGSNLALIEQLAAGPPTSAGDGVAP